MQTRELQRRPRPAASRAALNGATRALQAAYPILTDDDMPDRLAQALAALVQAGDSVQSADASA